MRILVGGRAGMLMLAVCIAVQHANPMRAASFHSAAAVRERAGPQYRDTKTETRTKKTAPLPAELRYVRPPPNPTHTSSPPLLQARNWAWSVLQFLPLQQQ